MDQHVSPSYHTFMMVTPSYHSNVIPIGALQAEKIAQAVLLYVFRIAFPASHLHVLVLGFWEKFVLDKSLNSTLLHLTHDQI